MSFTLFDASIPVYRRRLQALSAILDKAEAYAENSKIDQSALIEDRLYPNMLPFYRQVQMACGHAIRGSARLQGIEPATLDGETKTFADLKALIAKALAVLDTVPPEAIAAAADRQITFPVGDRTETLSGADYLLIFSMPNFYFHVTTAYAILRHNGLDIGKGDFMGAH